MPDRCLTLYTTIKKGLAEADTMLLPFQGVGAMRFGFRKDPRMSRCWRFALSLAVLGAAASCSLFVDLEPAVLVRDASTADVYLADGGTFDSSVPDAGRTAFLVWAGGTTYERRDAGDFTVPQSSLWLGKLSPNGDVEAWAMAADLALPSALHRITGVTAVGSLAYALVSKHGAPSEVFIYQLAGEKLSYLGKSPATQDLFGTPCVASHKGRLYVISSNLILSATLGGVLVGGWGAAVNLDTGAQPPGLMVNELGALFASERGMRAHAPDSDGIPLRGTFGLGDVGVGFADDFSFQTPFAFSDGYIFQLGGYQVSKLTPDVYASPRFTSLTNPKTDAGVPIAWRRREPMSSSHRGHSALVAKGNLYALGGVDSTSVSVARILPEGTLDFFRETAALPKVLYGNCNATLIEQD
jgi:hypothetical protein